MNRTTLLAGPVLAGGLIIATTVASDPASAAAPCTLSVSVQSRISISSQEKVKPAYLRGCEGRGVDWAAVDFNARTLLDSLYWQPTTGSRKTNVHVYDYQAPGVYRATDGDGYLTNGTELPFNENASITVKWQGYLTASFTRSGSIVTVAGRATRYDPYGYPTTRAALSSITVYVQRRRADGSWQTLGGAGTRSNGTYSWRGKIVNKSTFRAKFYDQARTFGVATGGATR